MFTKQRRAARKSLMQVRIERPIEAQVRARARTNSRSLQSEINRSLFDYYAIPRPAPTP